MKARASMAPCHASLGHLSSPIDLSGCFFVYKSSFLTGVRTQQTRACVSDKARLTSYFINYSGTVYCKTLAEGKHAKQQESQNVKKHMRAMHAKSRRRRKTGASIASSMRMRSTCHFHFLGLQIHQHGTLKFEALPLQVFNSRSDPNCTGTRL
jgi:hypothetical protein